MAKLILSGTILDEHTELTLADICRACSRHAEWVVELVDEGILEPVGRKQSQWRFPGNSLQRARTAMHLQRDLGVNLAGVALALDLMEEMESMRAMLRRMGDL